MRIRNLLLVIILSLAIGHWSLALNNPDQKVTEVIKNYVVTKYPDWSKDEVKVTFKYAERAFGKLRTYGEDVSFKILELYSDFKPLGNLLLPLEISEKGKPKARIFLQAKVEVYKDVAVAKRTIKKGKVLTKGDLKLEKRDVALLPQKYVTLLLPLIGKEAKMTIPKRSILFSWMAGELPVVRRGEKVKILVSGQNLLIEAKGTALEDGYPQEEIKVKRPGAKRILQAVVKGPGQVEVKL